MNLKIIGSSSSGNCYVLETPTGSLLLDCGLPYKDIQKALKFDFSGVCGCLVTHEHQDHCKAVSELTKAGIDCYMSMGTWKAIEEDESCYPSLHRIKFIGNKDCFFIGDFTIVSFDIEHDANEPLGFLIQYNPTGEKLLFATDTFYLKQCFNGLHYILIECNYIKDTVKDNIESGNIPEKMYIRLLKSHMSLETCKKFLQTQDLSQCRNIVLIHLSDSNSDSERMTEEVQKVVGDYIKVSVAEPGIDFELERYPF